MAPAKSKRLTKSNKKGKTSPKKSKKSLKKYDPKSQAIADMFFKQKRRPKPQATASAKLINPPQEEDSESLAETHKKNLDLEDMENNNNNNNEGEKDCSANDLTEKIADSSELFGDHPDSIASSDEEDEDFSFGSDAAPVTPEEGAVKKTKRFKCNVCDEWFPNRYFQRKHRLMEHEDQLFECRVCSFSSVEPEKLKRHIVKLHVTKKEKVGGVSIENLQDELDKLISCKLPRKVMMEDGVTLGRDVNTKMRFVCDLCSRIYTSKYSLERHVRCHTLERPYSCDVCDFTSSYREHMMRHMTSVHLIVHSEVPKVKYSPKKKVEQDKQPVEGAKKRRNILRQRYECAVCGLKNSHKHDLMEHIKEKHPNAHIQSLENKDGSKVHLIVTVVKQKTPTTRLTIKCDHCSLIFHDTWKHKVHLRSHTGVKPFRCSECEFRATSKMTIRDHIHRRHPDQLETAKIKLRTIGIDGNVEEVELAVPWKEFKCEYCQEVLKDNYTYKLHKTKNHKDEFPFQCTECGHKELAKAAIYMHCTKSHPFVSLDTLVTRNGKPIKVASFRIPSCEHCGKSFQYRSQLNIHMKQHTGEKSFECQQCEYKTNSKKSLDNHVTKKHMVKPAKSATRKPVPTKTRRTRKIKIESEDEE